MKEEKRMKHLKQFGVILGVSCLGEILRYVLPFAIPSTVYGLVLMVLLLQCKVIKLEQVKETSTYLLEIMPILFVPSAVALMTTWGDLQSIAIPVCIISVVSTILVLFTTGKVTDFMILRGEKKDE